MNDVHEVIACGTLTVTLDNKPEGETAARAVGKD
jgi:uncharacterized protein YunC (DUF1805 family)